MEESLALMLFRWGFALAAFLISCGAFAVAVAAWFRQPVVTQRLCDDVKVALAGASALEERFVAHVKREAGESARDRYKAASGGGGNGGADAAPTVVRVRGADGVVRDKVLSSEDIERM